MTVMTFAIRMQVFGVVHGLLLSTERIDSRAQILLHNPRSLGSSSCQFADAFH